MVRKCHRISNRGIPSPWGREARTGEKGIKSHPPHTMSMRATTNNSNQSMHLAMTTIRTITIRFAHFCKEHWTNCDFRLFRIGVCNRNCNFFINPINSRVVKLPKKSHFQFNSFIHARTSWFMSWKKCRSYWQQQQPPSPSEETASQDYYEQYYLEFEQQAEASSPTPQVWPITLFCSVSFKKIIDLPEGQINKPESGEHYVFCFSYQTPRPGPL